MTVWLRRRPGCDVAECELLSRAKLLTHSTPASFQKWLASPVDEKLGRKLCERCVGGKTYVKEIVANDDDWIAAFGPTFAGWHCFDAWRGHRKRWIDAWKIFKEWLVYLFDGKAAYEVTHFLTKKKTFHQEKLRKPWHEFFAEKRGLRSILDLCKDVYKRRNRTKNKMELN